MSLQHVGNIAMDVRLPERVLKGVPQAVGCFNAIDIDTTTFDLSVKNPNKADAAALRDPQEIIAEMVALDAESAKLLAGIGEML